MELAIGSCAPALPGVSSSSAVSQGAVSSLPPANGLESPRREANREEAQAIEGNGRCSERHGPFPPLGTRCAIPPIILERVAPEYPAIARDAGVDGTVKLDLLVCRHGRVVQTRVTKSIPMLDAAAVTCVEQWTFEPGRDSSRTADCWVVETPVKFTLH